MATELQIAFAHRQAMIELKETQENGDTEVAHSDADDALLDFLRALGYSDLVAEWEKVDKWYA